MNTDRNGKKMLLHFGKVCDKFNLKITDNIVIMPLFLIRRKT